MQGSNAYVVRKRYKYPLAICEASHSEPNMWKKDHDTFKKCKMAKEIAEERKRQIKEVMKTVAAYIAKMMKEWEDVADCIFAPYNFKYV